jgi:hypothetical protein
MNIVIRTHTPSDFEVLFPEMDRVEAGGVR